MHQISIIWAFFVINELNSSMSSVLEMKVQSTFYPDFISKAVDILLISSFITKNAQIIDI